MPSVTPYFFCLSLFNIQLLLTQMNKSLHAYITAPQSKNAVCALKINCKLLPFPWRNPAEMSRRSILFHNSRQYLLTKHVQIQLFRMGVDKSEIVRRSSRNEQTFNFFTKLMAISTISNTCEWELIEVKSCIKRRYLLCVKNAHTAFLFNGAV